MKNKLKIKQENKILLIGVLIIFAVMLFFNSIDTGKYTNGHTEQKVILLQSSLSGIPEIKKECEIFTAPDQIEESNCNVITNLESGKVYSIKAESKDLNFAISNFALVTSLQSDSGRVLKSIGVSGNTITGCLGNECKIEIAANELPATGDYKFYVKAVRILNPKIVSNFSVFAENPAVLNLLSFEECDLSSTKLTCIYNVNIEQEKEYYITGTIGKKFSYSFSERHPFIVKSIKLIKTADSTIVKEKNDCTPNSFSTCNIRTGTGLATGNYKVEIVTEKLPV